MFNLFKQKPRKRERKEREKERNCTKRQRGTVSLTLSHLPHIVTSLLIFKSLIQH